MSYCSQCCPAIADIMGRYVVALRSIGRKKWLSSASGGSCFSRGSDCIAIVNSFASTCSICSLPPEGSVRISGRVPDVGVQHTLPYRRLVVHSETFVASPISTSPKCAGTPRLPVAGGLFVIYCSAISRDAEPSEWCQPGWLRGEVSWNLLSREEFEMREFKFQPSPSRWEICRHRARRWGARADGGAGGSDRVPGRFCFWDPRILATPIAT